MYAMVCTRSDIAHAVGVGSMYSSNLGKHHWEAVKWILRYLKGTSDLPLYFGKANLVLHGYMDADFAGDLDTRRSITSYFYTLGSTAVSWALRLQNIVKLSTTEAEYVLIIEVSKEIIWLKDFLKELDLKQEDYVLYSDNQSVINLAKNPVYNAKTKHIDVRYYFIHQLLEDGELLLEKILRSKNPANILTKSVTVNKLKLCSTSVGLYG